LQADLLALTNLGIKESGEAMYGQTLSMGAFITMESLKSIFFTHPKHWYSAFLGSTF